MLTNESLIDRALRAKTMWGLLGLVPLLTGLVGFCPLYRVLGFSSCPAPGGHKQVA